MGTRAAAQLERTSDAVNKILEAAPDAVIVIGADGRIVRVNTQLSMPDPLLRAKFSLPYV
jgi:PAS domain-containing protein